MNEHEPPLTPTAQISLENTRKLDRLLLLIEGTQELPGFLHRLIALETLMLGRDGEKGIVQRVNAMWRAHVWLLCTLSGLLGYILKAMVDKIIH